MIIDDSIKEKEKIEKNFPDKINSNNIIIDNSISDINEMNISDDISMLIDDENNNINLIGEKIRDMDLFFNEE